MTGLFRMSVALLFQAFAMTLRSVLFFLLALLRPMDIVADWLQKVSLWLAVDNEMMLFASPSYKQRAKDEAIDD